VDHCEDKDGNHSPPPQNNFIQDSERNEENGHAVPDSSKTKINDDKKPNHAHKNNLKKEIIENFMEMLLDIVNQNV
jgi:hypothetical protein